MCRSKWKVYLSYEWIVVLSVQQSFTSLSFVFLSVVGDWCLVCVLYASLFELPVWLESVILAWNVGSAWSLETQALGLGDKILLDSVLPALSSELATRALALNLSLPLKVSVGGHRSRSLLFKRRCLSHHLSSRLLQVEAYLVFPLRVLLGEDWRRNWRCLGDAITGDRCFQKDFRLLQGSLVVISRFELLPWLVLLIIFTTHSWRCFTTFLRLLGVEIAFALLLLMVSVFFRWRHLVVGEVWVENWLWVVLRVAWDAQDRLSFNCRSCFTVPGGVTSVRLPRIEVLWALCKLVNVALLLSRRHIVRSAKLHNRVSQLAGSLTDLVVMHVQHLFASTGSLSYCRLSATSIRIVMVLVFGDLWARHGHLSLWVTLLFEQALRWGWQWLKLGTILLSRSKFHHFPWAF